MQGQIVKNRRFDRRNLYGYANLSLPYFARPCAELHVSADYLSFGKIRNNNVYKTSFESDS